MTYALLAENAEWILDRPMKIVTLRLYDSSTPVGRPRLCRYLAVATPAISNMTGGLGDRQVGEPAWSEQLALESLHKRLASAIAEVMSKWDCGGRLASNSHRVTSEFRRALAVITL